MFVQIRLLFFQGAVVLMLSWKSSEQDSFIYVSILDAQHNPCEDESACRYSQQRWIFESEFPDCFHGT
jgi:hypothetical protein